jgi:hypothetical protein
MNAPVSNQYEPLCTASGIYDDLELYSDQLVIRPRALFSQLMAYAEMLDLSDIESIKIYPKRSDRSSWIQMKIICHKHKPIEVSYRPSEQRNMRALNTRLNELLTNQKPRD